MSDVNITLDKLAAQLNVSTRHAERIVKQYTGKSFNEKRLETRISIAKSLIKKGNLSKDEIARKVGYNSYQGFVKAYNRYINSTEK